MSKRRIGLATAAAAPLTFSGAACAATFLFVSTTAAGLELNGGDRAKSPNGGLSSRRARVPADDRRPGCDRPNLRQHALGAPSDKIGGQLTYDSMPVELASFSGNVFGKVSLNSVGACVLLRPGSDGQTHQTVVFNTRNAARRAMAFGLVGATSPLARQSHGRSASCWRSTSRTPQSLETPRA